MALKRKDWLKIGGLLAAGIAAPYALPGLLGLGTGGAAAAGTAGAAGAGTAGGALAGGVAAALPKAGALATGATAGLVPGLSATGAGSQAAMLAAQNSGLGLGALAKTAEAGASAAGVNPISGLLAKGMGAMSGGKGMTAGNAMMAAQGMNMLTPEPVQQPGPSPFRPTQQPPQQGGFSGYDTQNLAGLSEEERRKILLAMAQRGMA